VLKSNYYDESVTENATVKLVFSGGTEIRVDYWRIISNAVPIRSSFDHGNQYGLPQPVDAIQALTKAIDGEKILAAKLDKTTGDISLEFGNHLTVQLFNFTGYEVWDLKFPDGTREVSNYIYRFE